MESKIDKQKENDYKKVKQEGGSWAKNEVEWSLDKKNRGQNGTSRPEEQLGGGRRTMRKWRPRQRIVGRAKEWGGNDPRRQEGRGRNWERKPEQQLEGGRPMGKRRGKHTEEPLGSMYMTEGEASGWWHIKITKRALKYERGAAFLSSRWVKKSTKWVCPLALLKAWPMQGKKKHFRSCRNVYMEAAITGAYLSGQTDGDSISDTYITR